MLQSDISTLHIGDVTALRESCVQPHNDKIPEIHTARLFEPAVTHALNEWEW